MSDTEQGAAEGQAANTMINVHAQYTKDLSFEAPGAPGIFAEMQKAAPELSINVDVNAQPLRDATETQPGLYEVALDIKIDCKVGTATAFLTELTYAGLFEIAVPREHLNAMLLIECPRLLFPFARNIVSEVARDGGFPPVLLSPIDFVQLYQQRVAQQPAAN